jgi:DNA-binding LacI/PurR family transcriptional regulator/signal transduction histidine kinase
MGTPVERAPVAVVIPGYAFYVSFELAAGIAEIFDPRGIPWISISGGYLEQNKEHVGLLSDYHDVERQSNWIYDFLPNADLSAAIIYGGGLSFNSRPEHLRTIVESLGDLPMVNVGSTGLDIPCVNADNYQGMLRLVDEIIGTLREKRGTAGSSAAHEPLLLYIGGPGENFESSARLAAFRDALGGRGIPANEEFILEGDFTSETARRLADEFFESNKPIPDAIICANDLTAFGVSEVLRRREISVPGDVLLTGFDDFEYAAAMYPSLTTVHFPIREMGREAARMILDLLDGETVAERNMNIPAFTVMRESTGHRLKRRQVARARDMLLFDMRAKERAPFRSMFTKILLESPRLKDIMPEVIKILPGCGISALLVILYNRSEGGEDGRAMLRLDDGFVTLPDGDCRRMVPDSLLFAAGGPLCPPDLYDLLQASGKRIHLCPLQHEDEHLGYLLLASDEISLDFPENVAYQISGYLYRWRLIRQARNQQLELESMITEMQRMQIRLDNAQRLSEMGRLVAGVGHELNTPVGSSLTLASFLADRAREVKAEKDIPAKLGRFVDQAEEAADSLLRNLWRTSELIQTFRSLSVDSSEHRVRDFYLYQVLDISIQRAASEEGFRLDVSSDCPEDLDLTSDPEAIEAVIEQLLDNSIRHSYTGEGTGRTVISVSADEQRVDIRYRDFGSVHPELDFGRLFEPFYTTARPRGRAGLGLHIVHNLIQYRMKGAITCVAPSAGGLEFLISVPRRIPSNG